MLRITVVIFCFVFCSCNDDATTFKGFESLVGKWVAKNNKNTFIETWKNSGRQLTGQGLMLSGNDTVFGEKLSVEWRDTELVYIADIKNQSPVVFTCTNFSDGRWKFENTKHDFPRTIEYTLKKDSLLVILTGKEKGVEIIDKLNFVRQ